MTTVTISPRLLRCKDAAKYLGIGPKRIRALVLSGELAFVQLGHGNSPLLLDVRDLDAFISKNKTKNE